MSGFVWAFTIIALLRTTCDTVSGSWNTILGDKEERFTQDPCSFLSSREKRLKNAVTLSRAALLKRRLSMSISGGYQNH